MVSQVKLVDEMAQFGEVRAQVLLIESDGGRTIVHLRAEKEADVRQLVDSSRAAVDGHGVALSHLVSHSGGTGVETHVAHVYDSVPPNRLVLLAPSGDAALTVDLAL
jgi:hypothetical protein